MRSQYEVPAQYFDTRFVCGNLERWRGGSLMGCALSHQRLWALLQCVYRARHRPQRASEGHDRGARPWSTAVGWRDGYLRGLAGEGAALLTGRGDVLMRREYPRLGRCRMQMLVEYTTALAGFSPARHSCAASSHACISSHSSSPSLSSTNRPQSIQDPSHGADPHQIPGPSLAAEQSISAEKGCFASRLAGEAGGSQQSSDEHAWPDEACFIRPRAI